MDYYNLILDVMQIISITALLKPTNIHKGVDYMVEQHSYLSGAALLSGMYFMGITQFINTILVVGGTIGENL